LLVGARGIPLSLVASGANTHDVKLLEGTLDARVARPKAELAKEQHLCADAAYVGHLAREVIEQRGMLAHVRSRKQEQMDRAQEPQAKPRRWIVERSHSWFNRFRKLLVRFEKSAASFEALLSLAAALVCWRQEIVIYG
jgi:transposase